MICNDSDIVKMHAKKHGLSGLLAVLDHIFLFLNEGIKPYYANLKAEAYFSCFFLLACILLCYMCLHCLAGFSFHFVYAFLFV